MENNKIKVLFIQHTSAFGGSSRSLLELIINLPKNIKPIVMCPQGKFSEILKRNNIEVYNTMGIPQFDHNITGYYRKFRWLILIRELYFLPFFLTKLFFLRKKDIDIIHVNDITQVYSIIFGKLFFNKLILHVRCPQHSNTDIRGKMIGKILNKFSDKIIVIDKTIKKSLNLNNVEIIHNGVSLQNVNKQKLSTTFTVGIVANFLIEKGILDFIEAANICINEYDLNIKFIVFGAPYSNEKNLKHKILQILKIKKNVSELVYKKLSNYEFNDNFEIRGFIENHNELYNNIDLHVFPSHLNAAGRPVFEAAFYKIPSIVAINNPFDDAVIDGQTGICIKEKDPIALANAIEKFYKDRKLLEKMGEESYKLAHKYYNSKNNALKIYELYKLMLKEKNV